MALSTAADAAILGAELLLSGVMNSPDPSACAAQQRQSNERWASPEIETQQRLERVRDDWRQHWQERRAQQRYPLGQPFSCNLELDNGQYPPMPVHLQDISLGGACLLISSLVQLRRGEMGELHHHPPCGPAGDGLDRRRLRVCWQEARDWVTAVGVAFEPPLEALPQQLGLP